MTILKENLSPINTYIPTMEVAESTFQALSNKKEGEVFKVKISFKVIEKTKSFTILAVEFIQQDNPNKIY